MVLLVAKSTQEPLPCTVTECGSTSTPEALYPAVRILFLAKSSQHRTVGMLPPGSSPHSVVLIAVSLS